MRHSFMTGFLAIAVASCSEPSLAPIDAPPALEISVRVEPDAIVAGTAANVVMTVKNTLPRSVEVASCRISFWVEGGGGEIVGGGRGTTCLADSFLDNPLRLRPFETNAITFQWPASQTQNVPAGMYNVFGWVNDPVRPSAPARITVLPAN